MSKVTVSINAEEFNKWFESLGESAQLELKDSIVRRFAQRHLKEVANEEVTQKFIKPMVEAIQREAVKSVSIKGGTWPSSITLTPRVKDAVELFVRDKINMTTHAIFEEEWARLLTTFEDKLKEKAELRINNAISGAVSHYIIKGKLAKHFDNALGQVIVEKQAEIEAAIDKMQKQLANVSDAIAKGNES